MSCSKELLIFNNLSKKLEDLLKDKVSAESKVISIETEIDHLQSCLENATQELKNKDDQIESINQALHLLEEDLVRFSMLFLFCNNALLICHSSHRLLLELTMMNR